jgi:hypothetical protein
LNKTFRKGNAHFEHTRNEVQNFHFKVVNELSFVLIKVTKLIFLSKIQNGSHIPIFSSTILALSRFLSPVEGALKIRQNNNNKTATV